MATIKSKDLSFNKQEPAFLRRIRESNSGHNDRHERPVARPQRPRDPNADEEDAPIYVDEGGDTLSKAEYDAMVKQTEDGTNDATTAATKPDETVGGSVVGELQGTEPLASGAIRGGKAVLVDAGVSKKRKVAKIVGGEDEGVKEGEGEVERRKPVVKKVKKKGKPIKLSFDDDEEA